MVQSAGGVEDAVEDARRIEDEGVCLPDAQDRRDVVLLRVAQAEVRRLALRREQRECAVQRGDLGVRACAGDGDDGRFLEERGSGGDEAFGEDGLAFVRDFEDHEEGLGGRHCVGVGVGGWVVWRGGEEG